MIIAESNIQLSGNHLAIEEHHRKESLTYWEDGSDRKTMTSEESDRGVRAFALSIASESSSVRISAEAKSMQLKAAETKPDDREELLSAEDAKLSILIMLVEKLTGKKIKLLKAEDLRPDPEKIEEMTNQAEQANQAQPADAREGWGLVYHYEESHYEAEATSFSAQGVIKTTDGREIGFNLNLQMSREFLQQENIDIRAGDALKDPLVINFSGNAAELTDTSFSFDLNVDGKEDQVAFVGAGSGFLVLDKNRDGVVNDGSELFGPTTNDGFKELALYDDDDNNWIDENDPVYSRLQLWTQDDAGKNQLSSLGQKGVGAIYLGRTDTPFMLKSANNDLLGAIRSSGIFARENGTIGTIQQVDMVV